MKKSFNEKHKLPLTFKYIETFRRKSDAEKDKYMVYFMGCEKYQTDYYIRDTPFKPLVRML